MTTWQNIMDFRGKVWCASPDCVGRCKRRLSDTKRVLASALGEDQHMSYAYFCGCPEYMIVFEKVKAKLAAILARLRTR